MVSLFIKIGLELLDKVSQTLNNKRQILTLDNFSAFTSMTFYFYLLDLAFLNQ